MSYLVHHAGLITSLSASHLLLVGTALAIALCFAVPLGIVIARKRQLAAGVLAVFGVIYTIPSLALFALLIPLLGLGFWTAVAGLAAYAQMILLRNIAAGIAGIDPAVREAAQGMGMSRWQSLWRVEWPLAIPVILAGIRVAVISLISIATVAAWINAGGLGTLVLDGIQHDYPQKAVAGAVAAICLSLLADFALRRVELRYARYSASR